MRHTRLVIAGLAAVLSGAIGCKHIRYSAFATVDGEMRKLATRNRYTLVSTKVEGQVNADMVQANLYSQQFTNDSLMRYQPGVFSEDGIKFMIRSTPFPRTSEYGWTGCTYLLSITVLPMCDAFMWGHHLTIDVLDNPDARDAFDIFGRFDEALSLFCPLTPILFFTGDAAAPDGATTRGSVSRHAVKFVDDDLTEKFTYADPVSNCYPPTYNEFRAYVVAAMLKKMEDEGLIDESHSRGAGRSAMRSTCVDEKFEVADFKKEDGSEHRYTFALKGRGNGVISLKDANELKKSLRAMVRDDYIASFPDASANSLIVDFPEFSLRDGMVVGKSEVLSVAVESLRYDSSTRRGTMRVRIGENQFEVSRRYARRNIEALVRDKNIALDARDIPPAAVFYLLGEKVDGHILELTFRTE